MAKKVLENGQDTKAKWRLAGGTITIHPQGEDKIVVDENTSDEVLGELRKKYNLVDVIVPAKGNVTIEEEPTNEIE